MLALSSYPKLHIPIVNPKLSPDKIAHFIEYLIFGILYLKMRKEQLCREKIALKELIIIMLIVPILDEAHQIPIPGRMFSIWDCVADTFGIGTSLLFIKRIYK
jgi:VanZ family protein